jgi:hypothetical protein
MRTAGGTDFWEVTFRVPDAIAHAKRAIRRKEIVSARAETEDRYTLTVRRGPWWRRPTIELPPEPNGAGVQYTVEVYAHGHYLKVEDLPRDKALELTGLLESKGVLPPELKIYVKTGVLIRRGLMGLLFGSSGPRIDHIDLSMIARTVHFDARPQHSIDQHEIQ